MRTRDMTPAQIIAYDTVDKLEVAVATARRCMDRGAFAVVDTTRIFQLAERLEDAMADDKCDP